MSMEDYDRLKQERDEHAAQVEVMRVEMNILAMDVPPELWTDEYRRRYDKALSITPSAALREIQAMAIDEAARFCVDEDDVNTLHELAAAKRKGEPT